MFDFSEIILRITIEDHTSNLDKRVVFLRPHFGYIEWIESISICIFKRHDLNIQLPCGEVSLFYSLKQILNVIIRIFAGQFSS